MARIVGFVLSFGLLVAQIQPSAAKDALCFGVPVLNVDPAVEPRLKVVASGADRVPFVKGSDRAANCPDMSAACAAKAFVVAGNPVIVTGQDGDFSCATFTGTAPRTTSTSGWLPQARLKDAAPADPINAATAWAGAWRSGDEKQITIRSESGNRIAIQGDATFGGDDPGRVQRGAVNSGQISATVPVANSTAAFAMDDDGSTKPFDVKLPNAGDVCRVKLWRLGSYLVAADNVRCGGMNVTFTGVYRRAGS